MREEIILSVVSSLEKGGVERVASLYANEFANFGYRSVVYLFKNDNVSIRNKKYLANIEIISDQNELIDFLNRKILFVYIHNNLVPDKLISILKSSGHILVEHCVWSKPDIRFEPMFSFQLSEFAFSKYCSSSIFRNNRTNTKPVILPNCFELPELSNIPRKNYTNRVVFGRIGQNSMAKWSLKYIEIIQSTLEFNSNCEWLLVGCPDELIIQIQKNLTLGLDRITFKDEINDDNLLASCYSKIDYFVAISDIGESFGLVLFEAISRGCYVLSLSTPWLDNSQTEYIYQSRQGKVFTSLNQIKKFCIEHSNKNNENIVSKYTEAFLSDFHPKYLTNKLFNIIHSRQNSFKQNANQRIRIIINQLKYVDSISFFYLSYWLFYLCFGNSILLNKIYIKIWNKL